MLNPNPMHSNDSVADAYMYPSEAIATPEKTNFDKDIANAYTDQKFHFGSCNIFEMNSAINSTAIKDDNHLAVLIASLFGYTHPIAAYKPINWQADGKNSLLQDDIIDLKEKYDLENLSKQDYYNLLSDLSNLNVISADDIHNQVSTPTPNDTYLIPAESAIAKLDPLPDDLNLIHMINRSFKVFCQKFEFICSKDFLHLNPNTNYQDYTNFIKLAKSKIHTYEKLKVIYNQLK